MWAQDPHPEMGNTGMEAENRKHLVKGGIPAPSHKVELRQDTKLWSGLEPKARARTAA